MVFLSQLLTVVNPKVTYHTNLKGLLHICDEYGIPHPDEKSIRSCMKKSSLSCAKQYFLRPSLIGHRNDIGVRKDQMCKAAVCLPRSTIPNECFEYFQAGIAMHNPPPR